MFLISYFVLLLFLSLCCTELLEELFCILFIFLCISVASLFGLKTKDNPDSLKAGTTVSTDNKSIAKHVIHINLTHTTDAQRNKYTVTNINPNKPKNKSVTK
jgi:hypothetical protein